MSHLEPHERLLRFWRETDTPVETRAHDEAEVAALETKYGVRLPAGFRTYFLKSGPTKDVWDGSNTWWALAAIKSVAEAFKSDKFVLPSAQTQLVFADYLIWSWGWAIDCAPGPGHGRVLAVHNPQPNVIAASFGEFVDLCIADDDRIRGGA